MFQGRASCRPMSRLDDRSRRRVARYISARRGELGLSQEELAARAGVDPKTLLHAEQGKRWPLAKTRTKLEAALGWGDGDMARVADGFYPRTGPLPEDDPDGLVAAAAAGDPEFDAQARRVIGELPAKYRDFVEEMYEMLQDAERRNRRLRSRIVPLPSRDDADQETDADDRESGSQRLSNS